MLLISCVNLRWDLFVQFYMMSYSCTVKRGIKDSQKSELLLESSLFIKNSERLSRSASGSLTERLVPKAGFNKI